MKNLKKALALLIIFSLLAAGLYGCGGSEAQSVSVSGSSETAQSAGPTTEPESEPTPEAAEEEQSLEDILNDILDRRDAKNATPAATQEPVPDDPFRETAEAAIASALELCGSGSKAADSLSDYSYQLADSYSSGRESSVSLEDYLKNDAAQLEYIKADREALSSLLSNLRSSYPESDTGAEIKKQLVGILGEMDKSYAQMQELAEFYDRQNELFAETMDFNVTPETEDETIQFIWDYYDALLELQTAYNKMKTPALVSGIWAKNTATLGITAESMYYSYIGLAAGSPLDNYVFVELSEYDDILNAKYGAQILNTMADCYGQTSLVFTDTYGEVLSSIRKNVRSWSSTAYSRLAEPVFEYSIAKEIYPNGYTSMDSVINLTASTTAAKQDVIISAQVAGFTQEYRQKVTLTTQPQYFMIKPALLTQLPDLSSNKKTQVNFTITDNDTGKVLVQESKTITLYSINDFFWETDEFGASSMFELLGWLRPESDAVAAINRQAISYLESTGMGSALAGYQYEFSWNEDLNTLIQVSAIQKAISDLGIRYSNDAYSFAAHQHILTPDQVLAKKTGLCIESTLLLASCLMSAGFHVMIVLIPGHAQVAVESWNAGNGRTGEYYLVETTTLPYDGFYLENNYYYFGNLFPNLMNPENSWWEEYLSEQDGYTTYDGDVFIIDCDLRNVMNIQGLESFHEEFKLDPVSYPEGGTTGDSAPAETNTESPSGEASGSDASGNDSNGSGSSSENGEEIPETPAADEADYSDYFKTVTSGDGTFSFDILKELTADTAYDSIVQVPLLPGSDLPMMYVFYGTGMSAADYMSAWIEMLKEDSSVANPPAEYTQMVYNGGNLYALEYEVSGGIIETMYLYELSSSSFAMFYFIYENDASEDELNYISACFQAALMSFKVES